MSSGRRREFELRLRHEFFRQTALDVDVGAGLFDPQTMVERVRRAVEIAGRRPGGEAISAADRAWLERELLADVSGYGPVAAAMSDPSVRQVLINGPDSVFVDRLGRVEDAGVRFDDEAHLTFFLTRLLAREGRHIGADEPLVDLQLCDGHHLHAVVPPLTPGPVIVLRRARRVCTTLDELRAAGTLHAEVAEYLAAAVAAGVNIVVAGTLGSGRTTLLGALAAAIPTPMRIVTIEDRPELQLSRPYVVPMLVRTSDGTGARGVSKQELVTHALALRADRLVVDAVDGVEMYDILGAMSADQAGSLATVFARDSADALRRIEMLAERAGHLHESGTLRDLVTSTVQVVVQIARRPDGSHRVFEVADVEPRLGTPRVRFREELKPPVPPWKR